MHIINPIDYAGWDNLILSHADYSFFHSSHWAKVLYESYQYKPLYFSIMESGELLASVPVMEIKSPLTGRRGVSLPFSDYCDPIVSDNAHFHLLFDYMTEYGKKAGWKYIEIRSLKNMSENIPSSSKYYGHTLGLSKDEDLIYSQCRSSTQRNIKKAEREGVRVAVFRTLESVREFYRLNCMTRKMHGLPPQPRHFFKKIYEHVISKHHGIIVLASYKGKTIAGAVYFHFGNKAIYKYGASNSSYQHLRANNLVMWEAINYYSKKGFTDLSFGRTDMDHEGLRRFKNGWGVKENIIKYHKYDCKKRDFIKGTANTNTPGFHNKVFRIMPNRISEIIGSLLYRHAG